MSSSPDEILARLSEARPRPLLARSRQVLVVSPANDFRRLVANVYRAEGHRAIEAARRAEAFARMIDLATGEARPFALVILDARNDDSTALELARILRESAPQIPIAMLVAEREPSFAARAHALGAVLLPLPLTARVLRTALATLSLSRPARRAA